MGLSPHLSITSQRDRIEQVTEGRFEPALFDATNQTEARFLEDPASKRVIITTEMVTEPIVIRSPKKFSTFMV